MQHLHPVRNTWTWKALTKIHFNKKFDLVFSNFGA